MVTNLVGDAQMIYDQTYRCCHEEPMPAENNQWAMRLLRGNAATKRSDTGHFVPFTMMTKCSKDKANQLK